MRFGPSGVPAAPPVCGWHFLISTRALERHSAAPVQFTGTRPYDLNLLHKKKMCSLSAVWQEWPDFLFTVGAAHTSPAGCCLCCVFQEQISCLIFQQISARRVCTCLDVSSLTCFVPTSRRFIMWQVFNRRSCWHSHSPFLMCVLLC